MSVNFRARLLFFVAMYATLHSFHAPWAPAREYPWLADANTQIILLSDPRVDFVLRIAALNRATTSIDSATYIQDLQEDSGLALLKAFREAQNRGVKGRYVIERSGSIKVDLFNRSARYLADPELRVPAEVVSFGRHRRKQGLRWTDMVHQKILIIDAGTPNELIWVGGRNNSQDALKNLDLAFILRPLDPSKPYLGDQIRHSFERLFKTTRAISGLARFNKHARFIDRQLPSAQASTDLLQTSLQHEAFADFNRMISLPVRLTSPLHPAESRLTGAARVITNDFLEQLLEGDYGRTIRKRADLPSDIARVVGSLLAQARTIQLSAMSVRLPQQILQGLRTALDAGAHVLLMTNGRLTHANQIPTGAPFDLGIPEMVRLLERSPNMRIHVLDPQRLEKSAEHSEIVYQHTKLLIADDQVIFGSDNFNDTSRTNNDEMIIQIQDSQFATNLKNVLELQNSHLYRPLSLEEARENLRQNNLIKRILNHVFLPFY